MRGLSGEEGLRGRAEESEVGAEAGVCEDGVEKEEVRGLLEQHAGAEEDFLQED